MKGPLLFLISIVSIIFVINNDPTSLFDEKSIEGSPNNLTKYTIQTYELGIKTETENKLFDTKSENTPILNIVGEEYFEPDKVKLMFNPQELAVKEGEEIIINNNSSFVMILTNGKPEFGDAPIIFQTDLIYNGDSTVLETSNIEPGIYPYYCLVHPWVNGTLIIKP